MQVQSFVNRALRRPDSVVPEGLSEVPELSGGLPIIGHGVDFVRSTIELLHRARREHGDAARFHIAHKTFVAVFGPKAHEEVFRAPDTLLSPADAYKIMTPVFGKNIVYDASPERMGEQLRMLLPALKDRRMRTYGEIVRDEVENSVADWGDEGTVDIVDYCRVLTNFTSAHCLLGSEFRSGMTDEFARVYQDLERGVTPVAYLSATLPLPSFRARDKARARLVEMISGVIDERLASKREGEDFLQTLMDAQYKNGARLTHDEITGMLLAAMFAGHHTSSVTAAFTLLELLQNPESMDRALAEIDETFGDGTEVSHASLRALHYTENAVKESLRLHPPLFMLVRVAQKDFVLLGKYHVPKGTWVLISPTASHQIPSVFRNPDRFNPQRFSAPREEDKQDYAYIPFGGGRHKCMGNAFALLQVKSILAILLRRYEFELISDKVESDFHGLVIGPKEPCRLRYKRRDAPTRAPSPKKAASPVSVEAPTTPYRVECDLVLCRSHAVCMGEASEVFHVPAHGQVELKVVRPAVTLRSKVDSAVAHCPTGALRVVEEAAGGCPFTGSGGDA